MTADQIKATFRNLGASYAEIYGSLVITSWDSKGLADRAASLMKQTGLKNVRRYMDGADTKYVAEGTI